MSLDNPGIRFTASGSNNPPGADPRLAALTAILDHEIMRWQRAEADTQQVTLAQYLTAILAALDGWTLVPKDTSLAYDTGFQDGLGKGSEQIARLRKALDGLAHPEGVYHLGGLYCPWCGTNVDVHGTTCPAFIARAALAGGSE